MALDASNKIINSQDGVVVDGTSVAGGYFVVNSIQVTSTGESGKIPDYACIKGALCYCTADSNFYQCTSTEAKTWEKANFGIEVPVRSVAGKTGAVTLAKSDVGLGNVANVLQYSASNPPPYPVTSVNEKTGAVKLTASDVGALPDSTTIPEPANDGVLTIKRNSATIGTFTANQASATIIDILVPTKPEDIGALSATTRIPDPANDGVLTIQKNGETIGTFSADQASATTIDIAVPTTPSDIGLSNVANERQYSASNPPPYPVTSVNGKTGTVTLSANDVGAIPNTTEIPTVNDATITIQVGGESQGTFTLNQSSNKSINITVATRNDIIALFDKYKEGNS